MIQVNIDPARLPKGPTACPQFAVSRLDFAVNIPSCNGLEVNCYDTAFSGKLLIDLEDRTIELNPNQGVTISKGVMHRPGAPQKTVMLMVETVNIDPIGVEN